MRRRIVLVAAATLVASPAAVEEVRVGPLVVERAWSRQTPPGAAVGGAYLTIVNTGAEPDRLVGGSATVAGGFEIHTSSSEDGVMRMRRLEDGVVIPPGETVTLAPMGPHVMLTRLAEPVVAGKPFAGTLVFEKAGTVEVSFAVAPLSATAAPKAGDEHSGHGG